METTENRCPWCGTDPLYVDYHDQEWGVPQYDSRALWEMLMLEGFQAGLSWYTILKRRETFRAAFHGFDPAVIAQWGEAETLRLLGDPGIIRHRGKIEATIAGARAYLRIEAQQGFAKFVWNHVGGRPIINQLGSMANAQAQTPIAVALSKALKAEGFKFCGPTITYAFMQASGLVNDHLTSCFRHAPLAIQQT
jgi:DNA-3-methyladenine glycosylase I